MKIMRPPKFLGSPPPPPPKKKKKKKLGSGTEYILMGR